MLFALCSLLVWLAVVGGDSSDNSKEKSKTIKEGETCTIEDYAEIKLFKIETTPTITGSTADSFVSYYADSDNTYVDVVIDCKNLTGESINSDDFLSLQGTNKDGASYTCTTFIVESGSNLDEYVDIKPKSNTRFHCALEVDKGENELDLKFDINKNEYVYNFKLFYD